MLNTPSGEKAARLWRNAMSMWLSPPRRVVASLLSHSESQLEVRSTIVSTGSSAGCWGTRAPRDCRSRRGAIITVNKIACRREFCASVAAPAVPRCGADCSAEISQRRGRRIGCDPDAPFAPEWADRRFVRLTPCYSWAAGPPAKRCLTDGRRRTNIPDNLVHLPATDERFGSTHHCQNHEVDA